MLGLAWWQWPALARDPERVDVVVVGGEEVDTAADEIGRHLRQRGLSVELAGGLDACDTAAIDAASAEASTVVLAFLPPASDECRNGAAGTKATLRIDPGSLLPDGQPARVGCEWWEPPAPAAAIVNCEPDALITVRDEQGHLTVAGRNRLARLIAGVVP